MKCSEIEKYLSEYMDDDVNPSVREQMDLHLADCGQCRDKLDSLKSVVNDLSQMPKIQTSPDFLNRLHARLEQESFLKKLLRAFFVPFQIKIPLELATATAIGIIIFFVVQPIHQKQMFEQSMSKKVVSEKKQEIRPEESLPSQPAVQGLAKKASEKEAEVKGLKKEEAPAPIIMAEKKQKIAADEGRAGKPMGQILSEAPVEKGETKTIKDEPPPTPIVISLLVPAQKELSAARQRTAESQSYKMAASSNDEKRTSDSISGAVSQSVEKTEQTPAPSSAQAPSDENIEQKIINIVNLLQGKIVSITKDSLNEPTTLELEIPASNYDQFIDQIRHVGEFESPPPEIAIQKDQPIPITIRFVEQP